MKFIQLLKKNTERERERGREKEGGGKAKINNFSRKIQLKNCINIS